MNTWILGDTHFGHRNLCRGTSRWPDKSRCRDFETIEQMDETIVSNINSLVKEEDRLICLGDWSFGPVDNIRKFRSMIRCRHIGLVVGNHDRSPDTKLSDGSLAYSSFSFYEKYLELTVRKTKVVIFHYPIASWNEMGRGSIHLHAHTHRCPEDKYTNGGKSMDVGLDGNGLLPYNLDEIMDIMKDRPVKKEGHHS